MPYGLDVRSFTFAQPFYLWLLLVPAVLLVVLMWRAVSRRLRTGRSRRERVLPVRERYAFAGGLQFWIAVLCAASLAVVALARPQARVSVASGSAADFVILQDGSAAMYARDVAPDRWRRSVRFLRVFADTLTWKGDRVALALFAHLASPQVRLTKDPNAFFFFLDHLGERSPFRLEDDPTWDTNIEEGLYWGLNIVQKDEELFGKSTNVKAFVVVSDGQAWSGNVAKALAEVRRQQASVYVVGVGTVQGAMVPSPPVESGTQPAPVRAVLDRQSLRDIARAGGGEYFELDRQSDRDVASRIARSVRSRATSAARVESSQELYWPFLFASAVCLGIGSLFLREATELAWLALTAAVTIGLLVKALG